MINKSDTCELHNVHEDVVESIRARLPEDVIFAKTAVFFKALCDETRLRIIWALDQGELCVCDLAQLLGLTQSAVSHQLRTLKDAKLVRFRREGKSIIYALDDDHVRLILSMGLEHLLHTH